MMNDFMILSSLLSDITARLAPISDTPDLDASVLVAHIIGRTRTWVMAHPELSLAAHQQEQLDEALARLERGEPFPMFLVNGSSLGWNLTSRPMS